MSIRQKTKPNLAVPARRGWCLQYVDDSVNARSRQPSAQASWNVEKRNTNTRTGTPPLRVWVPIYFSFGRGIYKDYGHVAWAYRRTDGSIDIVDSEVRAGARLNYSSIQEVINWFSAYSPKYLGWSVWTGGVQIVEFYTPKPVITTKDITVQQDVPFVARTQEEPELPINEQKLSQKGLDGSRTTIFTVTYTNGKETSRKVKSETISRQPRDEITLVGTYVAPELPPIEPTLPPVETVTPSNPWEWLVYIIIKLYEAITRK